MNPNQPPAPTGAGMPEATPTHEEARDILSRFNASHFGLSGREHARYSIPANPDRDDDIRLAAYIKAAEATSAALAQSAARIEELEREKEWLTYLVNFFRLPLGINPVIGNQDREEIINAFSFSLANLTATRAALAKALEDGKRLDWLETNGWNIHLSCWKGPGCETNPWTIHEGDFADDKVIGEADTLRAAIDAVLQPSTTPTDATEGKNL